MACDICQPDCARKLLRLGSKTNLFRIGCPLRTCHTASRSLPSHRTPKGAGLKRQLKHLDKQHDTSVYAVQREFGTHQSAGELRSTKKESIALHFCASAKGPLHYIEANPTVYCQKGERCADCYPCECALGRMSWWATRRRSHPLQPQGAILNKMFCLLEQLAHIQFRASTMRKVTHSGQEIAPLRDAYSATIFFIYLGILQNNVPHP